MPDKIIAAAGSRLMQEARRLVPDIPGPALGFTGDAENWDGPDDTGAAMPFYEEELFGPENAGPDLAWDQLGDPYNDDALKKSVQPWNPNASVTIPAPKPTSIRGQMEEAEIGLGIEPINLIAAELDVTSDAWSRGWALYGPGGGWQDLRKSFLAAQAERIRSEWSEEKRGKMTDGKVDDMAHACPEYQTWLGNTMLDRAQWIRLDHERDLLLARLSRGNGLLHSIRRGG